MGLVKVSVGLDGWRSGLGSVNLVGDLEVTLLVTSVCSVTTTVSYSESSVRVARSGDLEVLDGVVLGPLEGD